MQEHRNPERRRQSAVRVATRLALVTIGCLAGASAAAQDSAVRCGKLLDIRTAKLLSDRLVVVEKGRIASNGPAATDLSDGLKPIDLSAATCLPGLIDVHTHLTIDPTDLGYAGLAISAPRAAVKGVKNARLTLHAGFTTVRDVRGDGFADIALRDGVNAGDVAGPRMLVAGRFLGMTGGHCDDNRLQPEMRYKAAGVADGPWEVRAKVRETIKYGADLIKICASGGVISIGDTPGASEYTLEEMRAIVDEARRAGRKVAAHAHGTQAIKDAIRAGVDSVEHASLIDDEGIALAKEHGTILVFDIYVGDYMQEAGATVGLLPEWLEKGKQIDHKQRESFRRAHRAGARIAFGSDAGGYPHGGNAKQFALMVQWGMKPIEALQAATITAAELMGWSAEVGSLEPGRHADLIAVVGDPLADVRLLESVKFVMKGGEIIRNDLDREDHP